jgi:hypothetical protein
MAALFKIPVRSALGRAELLFTPRGGRNTAPLIRTWRRDAEGRLVSAWAREPKRPSAGSSEPALRAAAA